MNSYEVTYISGYQMSEGASRPLTRAERVNADTISIDGYTVSFLVENEVVALVGHVLVVRKR